MTNKTKVRIILGVASKTGIKKPTKTLSLELLNFNTSNEDNIYKLMDMIKTENKNTVKTRFPIT